MIPQVNDGLAPYVVLQMDRGEPEPAPAPSEPANAGPSNAVAANPAPPLPDLNEPAPPLTDAELAKETEANAAECQRVLAEICEEAKAMAKNAGVTDPKKFENIEASIRYLADVEHLDEEARIPFLRDFQKDLVKAETWQRIDEECRRWGGRGLCWWPGSTSGRQHMGKGVEAGLGTIPHERGQFSFLSNGKRASPRKCSFAYCWG